MLSQLRSRGFAIVPLKSRIKDALHSITVNDAATMNGFRFPPIEGPIIYSDSRRMAFRALFDVATRCFHDLLQSDSVDKNNASYDAYMVALQKVRDGNGLKGSFKLFSNEHEPFEQDQPFCQTFFNLFNYDHGSLNSHVDRSLLTVIYSTTMPSQDANKPTIENMNQSTLWIKDSEETWHNADELVTPNETIIMVGEDLVDAENGRIASSLGVFAAEHAVRVDPFGERIERSHFRRDPSCSIGVKRLSAVMILRHELE